MGTTQGPCRRSTGLCVAGDFVRRGSGEDDFGLAQLQAETRAAHREVESVGPGHRVEFTVAIEVDGAERPAEFASDEAAIDVFDEANESGEFLLHRTGFGIQDQGRPRAHEQLQFPIAIDVDHLHPRCTIRGDDGDAGGGD